MKLTFKLKYKHKLNLIGIFNLVALFGCLIELSPSTPYM